MTFFSFQYSLIGIFLILCFIISFILVILSYIFSTQLEDTEKVSPYECGFNPFDDSRNTFDIKFYLVAILFMIFDLEILFLFPWVISLKYIGFFGYFSMVFFLFILTLGFIYEWTKNAISFD